MFICAPLVLIVDINELLIRSYFDSISDGHLARLLQNSCPVLAVVRGMAAVTPHTGTPFTLLLNQNSSWDFALHTCCTITGCVEIHWGFYDKRLICKLGRYKQGKLFSQSCEKWISCKLPNFHTEGDRSSAAQLCPGGHLAGTGAAASQDFTAEGVTLDSTLQNSAVTQCPHTTGPALTPIPEGPHHCTTPN